MLIHALGRGPRAGQWMALAVVLVGAAAALGFLMEPDKDVPLETLLPPETLVIGGVRSVPDFGKGFEASGIYKAWSGEEVQTFTAPLRAMIEEQSKQFEKEVLAGLGCTVEDLRKLFQGQVTIALVDVPVEQGNPTPDAVIAIGISGGKKTVTGILDKLLQEPEPRPVPIERMELGGRAVYAIGDEDLTLHVIVLDHTLLASTTLARAKDLLDRIDGKKTGSLADTDLFKKIRGLLENGQEDVWGFANVAQFFEQYGPHMEPEITAALDEAGARGAHALGGSWRWKDGLLAENYVVYAPGERKGLLAVAAGGTPSDWDPPIAANGLVVYSRSRFDAGAAWDCVLAIVKSLGGADAADMEAALAETEKSLGFEIRKDLLASLGDEWVTYYALPEAGGVIPDSLLQVRLKDPATFDRCIDALLKHEAFAATAVPYRGTEIRNIAIDPEAFQPPPPPMPGMPPGMQPPRGRMGFSMNVEVGAYARTGDTLLFSNSVHGIKRHLARAATPTATVPANSHPAVAKALARVPGGADTVTYYDLTRTAVSIYNTVAPFAMNVWQTFRPMTKEFPLEPSALPTGEAFAPALGDGVYAGRSDATAITVRGSSNGAVIVGSAAVVGIAAAVAVPNLLESRLQANEMNASATLRMISVVQATSRQMDSDGNQKQDFWTGDVAGFYANKQKDGTAVQLVPVEVAKADAHPLADHDQAAGTPAPKGGYFFRVMRWNEDGEPYQADPDGDGKSTTNEDRWAVIAYPAAYGKTGRRTFIVNEMGEVFSQDIGPWPAPLEPTNEEPTPLDDEQKAGVESLVQSLNSDDFSEREYASSQLVELGPGALPQLEEYAKSAEDPEALSRLKRVIDILKEKPQDRAMRPYLTWPGQQPMERGWYPQW